MTSSAPGVRAMPNSSATSRTAPVDRLQPPPHGQLPRLFDRQQPGYVVEHRTRPAGHVGGQVQPAGGLSRSSLATTTSTSGPAVTWLAVDGERGDAAQLQ
ncbi:MAG: hypothetical protein L0H64_10760 [Pseudonocardia sp.]|nr:hypothetical protein [Pseudonocardia sp.]